MSAAPGYAIVIGSLLEKAEPTWHRAVYRTGTNAGRRWRSVMTLCGLAVASDKTRAGRVIRDSTNARKHAVLRQDHAEKIGRECSRCAARHKEALSG